jgi:anti-sigma B factor antagonist
MALTITTKTAEDLAVTVAAEGEVDVSCASELRDAIDAALEGGATGVTIDLALVPYIDSTGIGVLVGAAHRGAEAGTTVRVANPQRNVRRVLDMLGVVHELGIDE